MTSRFSPALRIVSSLLALAFAAGCSSTAGLSTVRSVSASRPSVPLQENEIEFATSGQTAAVVTSTIVGGVVGGAIAAAAAHGATVDERTEILQALNQPGNNPALLVSEEWEAQARAAGSPTIVPGGGDAEFRFDVVRTGLVGSAGRLYPSLLGVGSVVSRNGKTLWKEEVETQGRDDRVIIQPYPFNTYMRQPALLRENYRRAARIAARELFTMFREEYEGAVIEAGERELNAEERTWASLPKEERRRRHQARDDAERQRNAEHEQSERARKQAEKQDREAAKAERRRQAREARARR